VFVTTPGGGPAPYIPGRCRHAPASGTQADHDHLSIDHLLGDCACGLVATKRAEIWESQWYEHLFFPRAWGELERRSTSLRGGPVRSLYQDLMSPSNLARYWRGVAPGRPVGGAFVVRTPMG